MNVEPTDASTARVWSRRAFLQRAGSAALGGAALSLILAACGGTASVASSAPASTPASGAASPPASSAAPASSAPASAAASKPAASASASAATSAPASAAASGGAAPTGTLNVADADFATESMDPIIGQESAWAFTFADTFLTHDANGNYVGKIADSWDVSPDGTTWTFHLHPGVKFQNGDPMTSQDVLFSFQHFGDKKSTNPWSPYIIADAADITAPDDNTVVYKLKAPEWAIREPMAIMRVLPKNYFE